MSKLNLSSLLLVLAMFISCASEQSLTKEKIIGKWRYAVDTSRANHDLISDIQMTAWASLDKTGIIYTFYENNSGSKLKELIQSADQFKWQIVNYTLILTYSHSKERLVYENENKLNFTKKQNNGAIFYLKR